MTPRLMRVLAALRPRRPDPEAAMRRLRIIADEIEEALGRGGLLSLHDLSTTETGRPTMDLDSLIARWRRLAGHVRTNPGALTPAEVYEHCADALEARIRTYELQQREREAVEA